MRIGSLVGPQRFVFDHRSAVLFASSAQEFKAIDADLGEGHGGDARVWNASPKADNNVEDALEEFIKVQAAQGFEARRDKLVQPFAVASARGEVMWPKKHT